MDVSISKSCYVSGLWNTHVRCNYAQLDPKSKVFLSYVIAFPEVDEDKTLNVKLGFDLTQGTNGAPTLKIRNFEESSRKLNKQKERSVRADSSSGSDEGEDNKAADEIKEGEDTDLSDGVESSGSEGGRHLSTKGLNPEEYEPENKPKIHEKYKEEDSE